MPIFFRQAYESVCDGKLPTALTPAHFADWKKLGEALDWLTPEQKCDAAYADKTWDQSRQLRTDNRREFYRKVLLMLAWARLPKMLGRAKLLFHEISGFVNDRGAMERVVDDAEVARRRAFAKEESGNLYLERELGTRR